MSKDRTEVMETGDGITRRVSKQTRCWKRGARSYPRQILRRKIVVSLNPLLLA
jgi:hypothetical protein